MNNEQKALFQFIEETVKSYFELDTKPPFELGKSKILLQVPSYGAEEVNEAIESMLTTYVTISRKVAEFEKMFAEYIGTDYAVMVNSGSSANLLALSILTSPRIENRIEAGSEVIVPAIGWSTTYYPIVQCGLVPIFVDVDIDTFNINTDAIKEAITPKTKAIMPVHLMGRPCNMTALEKIYQEHNDLYIIEDTCEAHGAKWGGFKVGSFGNIGTFSFFFSHHISTIEGGMLVTDSRDFHELAKSMRTFGWTRDLSDQGLIAQQHQDTDPRFLFYNIGYCIRPTELQGAFGIHQLPRLEGYIKIRQDNTDYWNMRLEKYSNYLWTHREAPNTRHVWFGYPVTVSPRAPFTRKELVDFLESKGVETRPIMTGNFAKQPVADLMSYRISGKLPNASLISRQSFFWGSHQGIGEIEREAIATYIDEFMEHRV